MDKKEQVLITDTSEYLHLFTYDELANINGWLIRHLCKEYNETIEHLRIEVQNVMITKREEEKK